MVKSNDMITDTENERWREGKIELYAFIYGKKLHEEGKIEIDIECCDKGKMNLLNLNRMHGS